MLHFYKGRFIHIETIQMLTLQLLLQLFSYRYRKYLQYQDSLTVYCGVIIVSTFIFFQLYYR